jgi:dolichol kinase
MSIVDFVGFNRPRVFKGPRAFSAPNALNGYSADGVPVAAPSSLLGGRSAIRRGEILRKAIHMTPGAIPFALFLYPHPRVLPWDSLLIVTLITAVLTGFYIASKEIVRRPGETNFYSTCLSYPACILAMLLLFPQHPEFTCVVVVVLGFGDASAYIGGKLVGGRRLPWNSKKTWAGTVSFMLVAAPVATLAYFLEANTASLAYWGQGGSAVIPLGIAAICATAATVTAAIAESWETGLTDNLRVGVAASVAVIAAHYLTAGLFLT